MISYESAEQRTSSVEMKDVPQNKAQEAVNQYYSAKYNKCMKPQYKIKQRRTQTKKNKTRSKKTKQNKSKSKSKSKSRSDSIKKKYCIIKKNKYTERGKRYVKRK